MSFGRSSSSRRYRFRNTCHVVVSNSDSVKRAGKGQHRIPTTLAFTLLEQRKLVKSIPLAPLSNHLITTYRLGYLDSLPSLIQDQQYQHGQEPLSLEKTQGQNTDLDLSMKYLTFLPHSGFHNQRTELENALLLARLLNRTLIMPKVYPRPPMPWMTFHQLHERLLYQPKIGLEHCCAIIENQEEVTIEYDEDNEHRQVKEDSNIKEPYVFQSPPLPKRPHQQPEQTSDTQVLTEERELISRLGSGKQWPSREQSLEHSLPRQRVFTVPEAEAAVSPSASREAQYQ